MDKFVATLFLIALTCVIFVVAFQGDIQPSIFGKTGEVVTTIDSTQTN